MTSLLRIVARRLSLQGSVAGLVAFVCLSLVGLETFSIWNARSDVLDHGAETAQNLARTIAQHAEDTLRASDGVLVGIVDRLEAEGAGPETLAGLRRLVKTQVAMMPPLNAVGALDETGTVIVTSAPATMAANYRDRDYFVFHRTHTDRGLHIGRPMRSKATGDWVIPLTRRIDHPDGRFAGVASATLDIAYFEKFYDTVGIGEGGAIRLAATGGTVLVERPIGDATIADGVVRLSRDRRSDAYPLVATVALARDDVLAGWRGDAWRHGIGVGLLVTALGMLGLRLSRQIALRAATQRDAEAATAAAMTAAAQYRLLADHSTDMIVRLDLSGRPVYASPAARHILGWEPDELIGPNRPELTHPEDRRLLTGAIEALRTGVDRQVVPLRIRRKDGSYTWLETSFCLVRDGATGRPVEIVAVARDVTTRRLAEEALIENRVRLQSILDNAPVGISLKDREHRYVVINKQYETWFGVTQEQQLGRTLTEVGTDPEFAALMESIEDRVLATGSVEIGEVREPDIGTAPTWVLITKFPVRAQDGRILGVGTINQDISARRAAEQALQAAKDAAETANRAKSDFLASMSHEIRTPMNGIIGFADLLLDSELTDEQRRRAMLIKDSGRALLAILNDILDFSKIEAGRLELESTAMNVARVVDGAVSIVRTEAMANGLDLRTDLHAGLPAWIAGDPTRLRQILLNLLSNAVKFTARGGITVTVAPEPGAGAPQLRFAVTDTGCGIPVDRQHLLFKNFSQLDRSIARRFGGTGLGLAICKRLVEAMGGAIGVDSEPGRGSTFWFTLALTEVAPPPLASPPSLPVPAARARILVADDIDINQLVVEGLLTRAGHAVTIVKDGAAAVEAVRAAGYDLVLMDIEMPVMDGLAATRAIRRLGEGVRDVPIIALSANAMPEEIARCRAAGMNDHLTKPIDGATLLAAVAKWSGSVAAA